IDSDSDRFRHMHNTELHRYGDELEQIQTDADSDRQNNRFRQQQIQIAAHSDRAYNISRFRQTKAVPSSLICMTRQYPI
ncbi:hypothetical protein Tco_0197577, partial [Tanacetum coccineum]